MMGLRNPVPRLYWYSGNLPQHSIGQTTLETTICLLGGNCIQPWTTAYRGDGGSARASGILPAIQGGIYPVIEDTSTVGSTVAIYRLVRSISVVLGCPVMESLSNADGVMPQSPYCLSRLLGSRCVESRLPRLDWTAWGPAGHLSLWAHHQETTSLLRRIGVVLFPVQ